VARSESRLKQLVVRVAHSIAKRLLLLLCIPAAAIGRTTTSRRRRRGEAPRILRAPVPIISIHYAAKAERLYGYQSETLVYRTYRIHAKGIFDRDLSRFTRVPFVGQFVPYAVFLWALLRYDIFVFFFDGGLLGETPVWRLELPLLRRAAKHVVVYPYGGDARLASRTRAIPGWNAYSDIPAGSEDRDEADVAARVAEFGQADVVLGCADLVEDLPKLDGIFQFPIDVDDWPPAGAKRAADDVVTIVHAPNHPHYKGTRYIVDAVERLRSEGEPVELRLVQGLSGDETRAVYETADIVVDQLLIGAYAQFAIECMALGRPVVCYLNERFARHHPEWKASPIVSATPDTIVDELRRLVRSPALRAELGARGPDYVRRHHSLEAVGAQMAAVYERFWPAVPTRRVAARTLGEAGRS
jgi:hypothetical protein